MEAINKSFICEKLNGDEEALCRERKVRKIIDMGITSEELMAFLDSKIPQDKFKE